MDSAFVLKDRSDQELLDGIWAAIRRESENVAIVIAHLAEIDSRKLFLEDGCGSLKDYCMEVLHLSEDQAYTRIAVAKLAQKFPVVLEMLEDGLIHLTAVQRLGPSLTSDTHVAILEEATYKSMAQVEQIVARLRPQPAVPSRVQKLGHTSGHLEDGNGLLELQELLSHQVPSGDPAIIIKDSLLRRLKEVKKERFGAGKRQKKGMAAETSAEKPSRYIPKEIQKAVWERDQGQCTFVSRKGRECSARRFLEFHHIIPFAWRGETTVENLELRCRAHNAYEGELIFGKVRRGSKKRSLRGPTRFKTSATSSRPEQARERG